MHTEPDARSKWCPLVRYPYTENADRGATGLCAINKQYATSNCMASGCAMWRWASADMGYCGLAGKPEFYV